MKNYYNIVAELNKCPKENLSLLSPINFEYIFHYSLDEFWSSIYIMEKDGKGFARLYWYHDDTSIVYLSMLSVDEKYRKTRIGTELQEIREQIAYNFGAKTSNLCVQKDSWMYDWYKRRGYNDLKENEEYPDMIWMSKQLSMNVEYNKNLYLISDEKIKSCDKIYNIYTKEIDNCLQIFDDGSMCVMFGELSNSAGMRAILNSVHFRKATKINK